MKKNRRVYVCQSCGHQEPGWLGRCPSCSEWSTLVEEVAVPKRRGAGSKQASATRLADVAVEGDERRTTGIPELDRVLGGGLVRGALVLVGGDPGIGKST